MQKKFSKERSAICTHRYTYTLLKYLPTYLDEHIVREEVEHGLDILTRQRQPATSFTFSPYGIVTTINADIFFSLANNFFTTHPHVSGYVFYLRHEWVTDQLRIHLLFLSEEGVYTETLQIPLLSSFFVTCSCLKVSRDTFHFP